MKENMQKTGTVIVMSGPSGAGKSSLCRPVINSMSDIDFSVSCTTRKPRPSEKDGADYYFISPEEFHRRVAANEFIEHADVHGNCYGTLRSEVIDRISQGEDVVLDVDVQGAMQIKQRCQSDELLRRCCRFVFIEPPSLEELERRLRKRATETPESLALRLHNARQEMRYAKEYEYRIVNDHLETAQRQFRDLIENFRNNKKGIDK